MRGRAALNGSGPACRGLSRCASEERREKLLAWGVKVYAGTRGLRFEYGKGFPAQVQLSELRFDGSHAEAGPGTVSVVIDPGAWTAELMTHEGEVTAFPLPGGTQAVALAA
ncbi:hypothetical protein GCM10010219_09460 [Streptomyces netropsis]|nr:hypothetical protein GCM10010219_09460 [Streptomyces netropsis]